MPRLVAALDADVLVPIRSCDLLLTAFDLGLYEPVVSTEALIEVERNLIAGFPQLDPINLRRRVGQMNDALDDHVVDARSFGDAPDAINPKDRHVIAAALAGEASVVVTNDRRLRAETERAGSDLVPMSADDFAAHLQRLLPEEFDEVIRTLVAKPPKPSVTAEGLIEELRGPFPTMAAAWFSSRRS